MKATTKIKKAKLEPHHAKSRLQWAEVHQHWTIEDWKRVIWSDETKINRIGSDGRKWVWKKQGECYEYTSLYYFIYDFSTFF